MVILKPLSVFTFVISSLISFLTISICSDETSDGMFTFQKAAGASTKGKYFELSMYSIWWMPKRHSDGRPGR